MNAVCQSRFSAVGSRWITRAALLSVNLMALGCAEDVDSSDIRTAGMHPIYRTLSTGNGKTLVTGELRVGGDDGTFVVLKAGDRLSATASDAEKPMTAIDDGLRYATEFPIDAGGTVINVAFTRDDSAGDGNSSGPNSSVVLPEQFTLRLANLEEGAPIQRGTPIDIQWDPPAAGDVSWEVDGNCLWSSSGKTRDSGAFKIPANEIEVTGTDEGETCEVTITIDRTNEGTVDPIFNKEGGSIRATQRRTIRFTSTPAPDEAPPQ